jgi:hypothetical protein
MSKISTTMVMTSVFATGYNQSVPRPDLVVLPVPDVDVGLSLSGGVEPRGVQLLLAQGAVKARVIGHSPGDCLGRSGRV